MVYLKIKITENLYNELQNKGSQGLKDYGFEWLYEKGYIDTDREYKGCFLHKTGELYEIIFITEKETIR